MKRKVAIRARSEALGKLCRSASPQDQRKIVWLHQSLEEQFTGARAAPKDMEHCVEPRLDPDRGEAVFVSILTAGRQAMSMSPIERPANIVRRARFQWLDESPDKHGGRFVR